MKAETGKAARHGKGGNLPSEEASQKRETVTDKVTIRNAICIRSGGW